MPYTHAPSCGLARRDTSSCRGTVSTRRPAALASSRVYIYKLLAKNGVRRACDQGASSSSCASRTTRTTPQRNRRREDVMTAPQSSRRRFAGGPAWLARLAHLRHFASARHAPPFPAHESRHDERTLAAVAHAAAPVSGTIAARSDAPHLLPPPTPAPRRGPLRRPRVRADPSDAIAIARAEEPERRGGSRELPGCRTPPPTRPCARDALCNAVGRLRASTRLRRSPVLLSRTRTSRVRAQGPRSHSARSRHRSARAGAHRGILARGSDPELTRRDRGRRWASSATVPRPRRSRRCLGRCLADALHAARAISCRPGGSRPRRARHRPACSRAHPRRRRRCARWRASARSKTVAARPDRAAPHSRSNDSDPLVRALRVAHDRRVQSPRRAGLASHTACHGWPIRMSR